MVVYRYVLVSSVKWHVVVLGSTMQDEDKDKDKVRYEWQSTAKYCQALHGSAKNKKHLYKQISIILM